MPRPAYFQQHATALVRNGYEIVPVTPGFKNPSQGKGWQNKGAKNEAEVTNLLGRFGTHSVGILCRSTPALDFDTKNIELSDHMLEFALNLFERAGHDRDRIPVRYGDFPKSLIPCRWPAGGEARSKQISTIYIAADADPNARDVETHKLEVLGLNNQFVGFGDHDKASTKYKYKTGHPTLDAVQHDELPVLTDDIIETLLEEFEAQCVIRGLVNKPSSFNGTGHGLNGVDHEPAVGEVVYEPGMEKPTPKTELEIEKVVTALAMYPADGLEYHDWLQIAFALQEWGADGRKLFMAWTAKGRKYDKKKDADIFDNQRSDPSKPRITIRTLYALAMTRGWDGKPFVHDPDLDGPVDVELTGPNDKHHGIIASDDVNAKMERYNKKFVLVPSGDTTLIYRLNRKNKKYPFTPMNRQSFLMQYENDIVEQPPGKRGGATRPIVMPTHWLSHRPRETLYASFEFCPPGIPLPPRTINSWNGFDIEPADEPGDISLYLELLDKLITDPIERAYYLYTMAKKLQEPSWRPGTFIILKGEQGTGKNAVVEPIVDIIGFRHAGLYDNPDHVIGKYNDHLGIKIMLALDEAIFAGDKRQVQKMKSMVTSSKINLEGKFRAIKEQQSTYSLIVNMTNDEKAWQLGADDRRAVIINVSEVLRVTSRDHPTAEDVIRIDFWNRYFTWIKKPGTLASLLAYMLAVDVSSFDSRSIPRGKGWLDQRERDMLDNGYDGWVYEFLNGEVPNISDDIGGAVVLNENEPTVILKELIKESFKNSEQYKRATRFERLEVGQALKRLYLLTNADGDVRARPMTKGVRGKSIHKIWFPSLRGMRQEFIKKTKITLPSLDSDDDEEL